MYECIIYVYMYVGSHVYVHTYIYDIHACKIHGYAYIHIGIHVCRQTCMGRYVCMYGQNAHILHICM